MIEDRISVNFDTQTTNVLYSSRNVGLQYSTGLYIHHSTVVWEKRPDPYSITVREIPIRAYAHVCFLNNFINLGVHHLKLHQSARRDIPLKWSNSQRKQSIF